MSNCKSIEYWIRIVIIALLCPLLLLINYAKDLSVSLDLIEVWSALKRFLREGITLCTWVVPSNNVLRKFIHCYLFMCFFVVVIDLLDYYLTFLIWFFLLHNSFANGSKNIFFCVKQTTWSIKLCNHVELGSWELLKVILIFVLF